MGTFRTSISVIIWPTTWWVMSMSSSGRKTKHKRHFRILWGGLTKVSATHFYNCTSFVEFVKKYISGCRNKMSEVESVNLIENNVIVFLVSIVTT